MPLHKVADWIDAYANIPNIAGGERWPGVWGEAAKPYRARLAEQGRARLDIAYGPRPRNLVDLFLPESEPRGLVVFVHGGFWRILHKNFHSHFAAGPLAHGWAVAMPTYTLAPEIRITEIAREVAQSVEKVAGLVDGPIRLIGHSVGGQIVTRLVTTTSPLSPDVVGRIRHVVSLAGLHDLRPLVHLAINADMRIDDEEADAESPALLRPVAGTRLTAWCGQNERAEFVRQSELIANIWKGLGAATDFHAEPDRHHFTVVEGLTEPSHPLVAALLS